MKNVIALFERALAVPPAQRDEFLERECGDDIALRQELNSLLEAHESAPDYFDHLSETLIAPTYAAVRRTANRAREVALRPRLQAALGDTYRILDELGGGMSRVFLAVEARLDRKVVIKVLPPETASSANAVLFQREIQLVAQLQHAHIVPLLTSDSVDSLVYYTMPFVAGESLRTRLARDGPLPVHEARAIWRDMLDALAHAHGSGVIHRDIKPGNILLGARNALITDFGIARAIEAAGADTGTSSLGRVGTPAYLAPEQVTGEREPDHRADIYSAGLVMYEMLEGRLPYSGGSLRDIVLSRLSDSPFAITRSDCPPALAELVMQCLAKEPEARPHAEAVLASLDAIVPEARSRRLHRIAALSGIALLALGVAVPVFLRDVRDPPANAGYTTSVEAWEWYERGMDLALFRSVPGRRQGIQYFERAIAADSNFAAAYAGLAHLYLYEGGTEPGDYSESYARAEQAARTAVALDGSLANAHSALGWAAIMLMDWKTAEAALEHAVALDFQAFGALEGLARLYMFTGRPTEQLATAWRGMAVQPYSHSAIRELALALAMNGRCDEAIERLRPLKSLTPPAYVAGVVRGQCYAAKQMWPEAIEEFRWATTTTGNARVALSFLGYALARAGREEEARAILSDLLDGRGHSHGAFGIAAVYAGLGDYDQSFAWLHKSIDENSVRVYLMGPVFDDLRRDPRFAIVRQRMGL